MRLNELMETLYGLLSDLDGKTTSRILREPLDYFAQRGVHAVVILGEAGAHLSDIARWSDTHKKDVFAIPGSHEPLGWMSDMHLLQQGYPLLHNGVTHSVHDWREHRLVFVPGSEIQTGKGAFYLTEEFPTGPQFVHGKMVYCSNVNDLRGSVENPASTLIMSHTPPLQSGEDATDWAEFSETEHEEELGQIKIKHRAITPGIYERFNNLVRTHDRKEVREENRGYGPLRQIVDEKFPYGSLRLAHGHYHESTHRTRDRRGGHVREKTPVREVIHNASCMDLDRAAIWAVRGNTVSIENLVFPM